MLKIITAIWESFAALNPVVTLLSGGLTLALALFNFFNSLWSSMMAKIATMVLPASTAGSIMDGLAFVNYFFPLTEFFGFLSVYLSLWLTMAGVRIIKSFVPTIS
jgi:hypothetical protein